MSSRESQRRPGRQRRKQRPAAERDRVLPSETCDAGSRIRIACPRCQKRLWLGTLPRSGKRVRCARCRERFAFESATTLPDGQKELHAPTAVRPFQPRSVTPVKVLPAPTFHEPTTFHSSARQKVSLNAFAILFASTTISISVTAIALAGIAIGAFAFRRAEPLTLESKVARAVVSPAPVAPAVVNKVTPAGKIAIPAEPVAAREESAPSPVDSAPMSTGSGTLDLPNETMALIALYSPETARYITLTVAWAVDDHHWVTTGLPYWQKNYPFVALMRDRQFVLAAPKFHPKLIEAMSQPEPNLEIAMNYDVAIFTTSTPIPRTLSTKQGTAAPAGAATLLSVSDLASEIPADYLPYFERIPANISEMDSRIVKAAERPDSLLGGAPVLDPQNRVVGMVQIAIDEGEASILSMERIDEAYAATLENGSRPAITRAENSPSDFGLGNENSNERE